MVRVLSLALILTFSGCLGCAVEQHKKSYEVDPILEPYVQKFEVLSRTYGRPTEVDDLQAVFTNEFDGSDILGMAEFGPGTPVIKINASEWPLLTSAEKEILVFHELGHAILGRDHNNREDCRDQGIVLPCSVMNEYLIWDWFYLNHEPFYHNELFNGR